MRIQHNIAAMSSYRNYNRNTSALNKNLEKLSSGYKINRAGDDAAGLAISEKMRAQITGLNAAQKNVKDGISLVKTAEGAMQEVQDMLNRMDYLATQSANGTYDNEVDRKALQDEVNELLDEIDRIADSANFNGIKLLDGSLSKDTSNIASLSALTTGTGASTKYTAVTASTSPVTWATEGQATGAASAAPATNVMHLHSGGATGAIGSFTIDLKDLAVGAVAGTKSQITLSIGSATVTLKGAADSTALTASGIASLLASHAFAVSTGGTVKILKGTDAVATGDLVYKATVGTGVNANKVTFTAYAIAAKGTDASNLIANTVASANGTQLTATNANTALKAIASAQAGKLDFKVTASAVAGAGAVSGVQHVGVDKWTDTVKTGEKQFGQAVVKLDASKITDGMKITVNGVSKVIRLTGTAGASDIDLTHINASTASGHATAVAQAIANAFAAADTNGVEVGAQDGHLTISEKVDNGGTSAATTATKKAMESYASFVGLVKFETAKPVDAKDATMTLTVDTGKMFDGNTLSVKVGTATKKFTFVKDSKTAVASDAVGIMMGSNVGTNLANAIKAAFGSSVATAVAGSDGKVAITINLPHDTTATAAATMVKASITGKNGMYLQIGDTSDDFNRLNIEIKDMHAEALGVGDLKINTAEDAAKAIQTIKDAINNVSSVRGTLGAKQNRLEHTANNLSVMAENIQDAESTIRDTDIAEEMMAYTKNNILVQSAQAMLAQANQIPQGVLQLLG